MSIKDKVAIVTGAARGIGFEIAKTFAAHGARVAIADLQLEHAEKALDALDCPPEHRLAIQMDVTSESSVNAGVAKVVESLGGVHILMSNAGIQHIESVDACRYDDWRKVVAVHLDGAFLTTKACLQQMYAQGEGGSIIYMGSVHSKVASVLKAPYVSAKHGIIGLCRTVAKEGAKHGVRANVICPGFVYTELVEKQIPEQAKNLGISEEEVVKNVMLGQTVDGEFTTLADVAQTALIFADFETNALTGQSLIVSHGWCME